MNVPIVDDEVLENSETLELTLQGLPGLNSNITLAPVDAVVEITENDGRYGDHMVALKVVDLFTVIHFRITVDFMSNRLCLLAFVNRNTSPAS